MKTAITDKLDSLGIAYAVRLHAIPVYTSEDAARERGVRLSQIIKTMVLVTPTGEMVVAVMPGDRRLDPRKVKRLLGVKDLRFLERQKVEHELGLVAGAIAPISDLFREVPVLVDPAVFAETLVDISSGDPKAGLELESKDLRRLLEGSTIAPLTQEIE